MNNNDDDDDLRAHRLPGHTESRLTCSHKIVVSETSRRVNWNKCSITRQWSDDFQHKFSTDTVVSQEVELEDIGVLGGSRLSNTTRLRDEATTTSLSTACLHFSNVVLSYGRWILTKLAVTFPGQLLKLTRNIIQVTLVNNVGILGNRRLYSPQPLRLIFFVFRRRLSS